MESYRLIWMGSQNNEVTTNIMTSYGTVYIIKKENVAYIDNIDDHIVLQPRRLIITIHLDYY